MRLVVRRRHGAPWRKRHQGVSWFVAGDQDAEVRLPPETGRGYSVFGGKAEAIGEGTRRDDLHRLHLLQG